MTNKFHPSLQAKCIITFFYNNSFFDLMKTINDLFENQLSGYRLYLHCKGCGELYIPPLKQAQTKTNYPCPHCAKTPRKNEYAFVDHAQAFESFYSFNGYFFIRLIAENKFNLKCNKIQVYTFELDDPEKSLTELTPILYTASDLKHIHKNKMSLEKVNYEYENFKEEWRSAL